MIINSISPRLHKNHTYGGARLTYNLATNTSYIFVHIPKCASCWMKAVMGNTVHWNYLTNTSDNNLSSTAVKKIHNSKKQYIALLRDPVKRWVSGLVQCRLLEQTNTAWATIFDTVVYDNHTEPQVSFLNKLDTADVTWFYCDSTLTQCVDGWIQENQFRGMRIPNVIEDIDNMFNIGSQKSYTDKQYYNQVAEVLASNPGYKKKLIDFYEEDYHLINSVSYYGS